MLRREAFPLHRGVRLEDHEHLVAGGADRVRHLAAAEPPEHLRVGGVAIVQHHVVVGALLAFEQGQFLLTGANIYISSRNATGEQTIKAGIVSSLSCILESNPLGPPCRQLSFAYADLWDLTCRRGTEHFNIQIIDCNVKSLEPRPVGTFDFEVQRFVVLFPRRSVAAVVGRGSDARSEHFTGRA